MWKTIETEHLLLRPFEEKDASSFYRNVQSDFFTMMYLDQDPAASVEDTEACIRARIPHYGRKHFYDWIIIENKSSEAIGEFNASWNATYKTADIGYALGSRYWGHHFATEALKAIIRFFFVETECMEVIGACSEDNPASMQVMMNAGMLPEHHLPEELRKMESFADPVYFSIHRN